MWYIVERGPGRERSTHGHMRARRASSCNISHKHKYINTSAERPIEFVYSNFGARTRPDDPRVSGMPWRLKSHRLRPSGSASSISGSALASGSASAACTEGAAAAAPLSLYMKTEHVTVTCLGFGFGCGCGFGFGFGFGFGLTLTLTLTLTS